MEEKGRTIMMWRRREEQCGGRGKNDIEEEGRMVWRRKRDIEEEGRMALRRRRRDSVDD